MRTYVASRLPMKSFVWQIIGGYLTMDDSVRMQAVSRYFYEWLTANRLCP